MLETVIAHIDAEESYNHNNHQMDPRELTPLFVGQINLSSCYLAIVVDRLGHKFIHIMRQSHRPFYLSD